MYHQKLKILVWLPVFYWLSACAVNKQEAESVPSSPTIGYEQLFQALADTVGLHFYDTTFIQKTFPQLTGRYRTLVKNVNQREDFDALVRGYLAAFQTSHTSYHTPADYTYYHLAGIFEPLPNVRAIFGSDGVHYPSIGLLTERKGDRIEVISVLDGSPAQVAGFKRGDQLQWIDGEAYSIEILRKYVDQALSIPVQRDGRTLLLKCTPHMVKATEEMLEASRHSARLIEKNGRKIAYIHMWSFAGQQYYELLREQLLYSELAQADALILDIRDGWGGASPEYLNIFNRNIPNLNFYDRQGTAREFSTQWRKPVALLINRGSRSGKEILAYGFKKYDIGPVIGERTAGAVTAGRIFFLPDNSLLYLAVNEVAVDGEILEGIGVYPDFPVNDDPATEVDEQVEEAIRVVLGK